MSLAKLEPMRALFDHFRWAYKEEDTVAIKALEWKPTVRVTFSDHIFLVQTSFIKEFWRMLDEQEYGILEMMGFDISEPRVSIYTATTNIKLTETFDDPFYNTIGYDYTRIEKNVENLARAISPNIMAIGKALNAHQKRIKADGNIIKDHDCKVTFDVTMDKDAERPFNMFICMDKVPPFITCREDTIITRKPVENPAEVFGEEWEVMGRQIDLINAQVYHLLESTNKTECLYNYCFDMINGSLVRVILDHVIHLYDFTGDEGFGLKGEMSPNAEACHKYFDEAIGKTFEYLEKLDEERKVEGIDLYAIDIETMAIFGRTKENRTVGKSLPEESEKFINQFSSGFEQALKRRFALIDNPHFFRA